MRAMGRMGWLSVMLMLVEHGQVDVNCVMCSRANACESGLTDVESERLLNHGLLAVEQIDLACEATP